MAFTFSKITFEDQFAKLEQTEQWLKCIGVQTDKTRFDEVLKLNREITEHHKKNLVDELIEKYGNLKLWIALTDAADFIDIHNAFKNAKSHIHPRAKLKKMLAGPYHAWHENVHVGNIEPRNTLFELSVAAKLKEGGSKITGFDDVDFLFQKTPFNAQCKRLHSSKKVKDNINEASAQFFKKMKSKPNLKGIICLSIDKLYGSEELLLKVNSPDEIRPKLSQISESFIAQHASLWHNFMNTNILAVLLFFQVIAIIKEQPHHLLTTCRDVAFDVIPRRTSLQLSDYNLILNLGRKLQRAS